MCLSIGTSKPLNLHLRPACNVLHTRTPETINLPFVLNGKLIPLIFNTAVFDKKVEVLS